MASRSIKTKIVVTLALLLLVGMCLIDFVNVSTMQRDHIQNEIKRGHAVGFLQSRNIAYDAGSDRVLIGEQDDSSLRDQLDRLGYCYALIMGKNGTELFSHGDPSAIRKPLSFLAWEALSQKKAVSQLYGYTWGVFWRQRQYILMATPVLAEGEVVASISYAYALDPYYNDLRKSQRIVFLYIFVNAGILSLFGLFRLYQLTLKPIHRLSRKAEDYTDDGPAVFLQEREEDEFGHLSKSLNRMLNRISDDKEALKTSLEKLEKTNFELKRAQNEIIRAEKLASVGRLSAGIAHEVGNPIGIVLGYLELLKDSSVGQAERMDYIERAEAEIGRIKRIIRQLLDFSRPDAIKIEIVSVHEILDEVIEILSVQPLMREIEIVKSLAAAQDRVMMDPNQLRQVFVNLLMNAADAIAAGENSADGRIVVGTEITEKSGRNGPIPMLTVTVEDNGHGIPEDSIESIFDPFFTTKEPGKGTGLGLSVCFMIVDQVGGAIQAKKRDGGGTRMEIGLPLDGGQGQTPQRQ